MTRFGMSGLIMAVGLALAGCQTPVRFESSPPGAQVTYEQKGMALGTTPFSLKLKHAQGGFEVKLSLEGHEPAEAKVQTDRNSAVSIMLRPLPPAAEVKGDKGQGTKADSKKRGGKVRRDDVLSPF